MKKFNPVFFILLALALTSNQQPVTSNCFSAEQKNNLWLVYSVGISDGAQEGDGVDFKVEIGEPGKKGTQAGEELWTEMNWRSCKIDMSKFRDKKIALKFITDPGASTNFDWACWGDIYIIEGDLPKEFDGAIPASGFDIQKIEYFK